MNTSTFADRLKELMYYYRLNKNSLSVKLGFTANTSITRLANHPDRYPSFEILSLILKSFPEISAKWLILGEGKMLIQDEVIDRGEWIQYFKKMRGIAPFAINTEDPTDLIRIYGFSDCELAVDVFGDSMAPRIVSGDIVICKQVKAGEAIAYGEAYLICANSEPAVRYIKGAPSEGVLKLGAENPRFEDYEMKRDEIIALFRVKGLIRREAV